MYLVLLVMKENLKLYINLLFSPYPYKKLTIQSHDSGIKSGGWFHPQIKSYYTLESLSMYITSSGSLYFT